MGVFFGTYKMTPGVITDGLIMHVDMASNFSHRPSTLAIKDLSGRNADAIMSSSNYTSDRRGGFILNSSVQSNAVVASSNNITIQNTLTMGMWFYPETTGQDGPIFTLNNGGTGFFKTGLTSFAPIFQTTTGDRTVNGTNLWQIGNLYYYALTYDGTNLKLYRNGSQVNATESSGGTYVNSGVATNYVFGRNTGAGPGTCRIYMAHIYNRALSDAEVSQNFNGTRSRFGV